MSNACPEWPATCLTTVRVIGMIASGCAVACACDPMVDTDYAGEPLIRLQGAASTTSGDPTTVGVKAAALWQGTSYVGPVGLSRLPLSIEFPVFWIDVLTIPGDELTFTLDSGEPPIAEGYLHIVKPTTAASPRADDFLATDFVHALVYLAGDVPANGPTAAYLGGALAGGFH